MKMVELLSSPESVPNQLKEELNANYSSSPLAQWVKPWSIDLAGLGSSLLKAKSSHS